MRRKATVRRGSVVATAAAVVAGALVLSGCGSGDTGASGSTKVAAVIKGLDNPFFQSMRQGIETQAKSAKLSTTVQAANS
ncbi:sugar ABC transporter substrate-binding protein, partial [Streptomyces sp. MCAF7]